MMFAPCRAMVAGVGDGRPEGSKTMKWLGLILAGIVLIAVIQSAIGRGERALNAPVAVSRTPAPPPRALSTAAAVAPQKEYVNKTCAEVADMFSAQSRMTDLQKDKAWQDGYDGRWVRWTASVNSLDGSAFGGIQLQFKCSKASLLFDGHAEFGDDQRDKLMNVGKDSQVTFEGRLKDHGDLLGLAIGDATLVP